MTVPLPSNPLRVAIVGAGPGGLAATIQLSRLPYVELSVFDQARELREVGAVSVSAVRARRNVLTLPRGSASMRTLGGFFKTLALRTSSSNSLRAAYRGSSWSSTGEHSIV